MSMLDLPASFKSKSIKKRRLITALEDLPQNGPSHLRCSLLAAHVQSINLQSASLDYRAFEKHVQVQTTYKLAQINWVALYLETKGQWALFLTVHVWNIRPVV